ncbi:MAG: SurA N-terminal domain-containing protein [Desulfobacterales bacterium]
MLNAMRQSAGSWIIKVLLGIIVVAFTFMGVGSFNARQNAKVATVNGDIIDITQYQQAYYNVLENLRARFGNQLNDGNDQNVQCAPAGPGWFD